jgi:hypothetical protein
MYINFPEEGDCRLAWILRLQCRKYETFPIPSSSYLGSSYYAEVIGHVYYTCTWPVCTEYGPARLVGHGAGALLRGPLPKHAVQARQDCQAQRDPNSQVDDRLSFSNRPFAMLWGWRGLSYGQILVSRIHKFLPQTTGFYASCVTVHFYALSD